MSFEASELVSARTRTLRSCNALTVACAPAGSTPGDPPANEFDDIIAVLAAGDGFRIVGDDSSVRPYEIVAKLGALGRQLVKVLIDRIRVVSRGDLLTQANQDAIEISGTMGAIDDRRDRHGRRAVPELVEYPRKIADNGPDRHYIQIAIIGDGVHAIIDVTDIAATDNCSRIVSNHQLVMHAAIDPAEIENEVEN